MSPFSCTREREVNEMLHRGHWPEACASELREHVDGCRTCSDLVLVTKTFQAARAHSAAMARPESAGALWWRAQLRRRNAKFLTIAMALLLSAAALFANGCSSFSANTAAPGNYVIQVTGTGANTNAEQFQNLSLTITK